MLRSLKDVEKYKVSAVDGDIGRVTDFLFDNQHWTIRYLVTDASAGRGCRFFRHSEIWSQHSTTLGGFLKTSFTPLTECLLLVAVGAIPLFILEIRKVVSNEL